MARHFSFTELQTLPTQDLTIFTSQLFAVFGECCISSESPKAQNHLLSVTLLIFIQLTYCPKSKGIPNFLTSDVPAQPTDIAANFHFQRHFKHRLLKMGSNCLFRAMPEGLKSAKPEEANGVTTKDVRKKLMDCFKHSSSESAPFGADGITLEELAKDQKDERDALRDVASTGTSLPQQTSSIVSRAARFISIGCQVWQG